MAKIRQDIEENLTTNYEAYEELPEIIQEKLEWFKDQKIGVIFYWELYAVAGIVESWQMSEEDDWARKNPWRNDIDELRAYAKANYGKTAEGMDTFVSYVN